MAHFGHHLLTALPIPLSPLIRNDFNLDYTQTGFVISAFTLSYGFGQLPAGWLTDRIGPRIMITLGICGVAFAGLLVGLSYTYLMMILFLVLMGIMGGGYHPAAPPMIVASVKPEKRGSALGLHLTGGSASYFLAPIIAAAIAATWGWRGSFIGLAVPAMIFGVIFYMIMGRIESAKGKNEKAVIADPIGLSKPGRVRRLVIIIILSTFLNAVLLSVASFVPLFLVDHFGIAESKAAAAMAFMYSAGLWASPLGGYLSDRLGRVPIILAICLCAGPAIYMFNVATGSSGAYAVLILIGIIYFIRMPVSESYIVGKTSVKNRSTILGIYFFSGMEGGGVLTPVMGFLIDRYGFQNSFTVAAAAILIVTLIGLPFLRNDRG
ncbi:MAG: MFS transporter [Syntrophaceae bacterium]|nr:MFS transporter [Syntrophaceae bacterium]